MGIKERISRPPQEEGEKKMRKQGQSSMEKLHEREKPRKEDQPKQKSLGKSQSYNVCMSSDSSVDDTKLPQSAPPYQQKPAETSLPGNKKFTSPARGKDAPKFSSKVNKNKKKFP